MDSGSGLKNDREKGQNFSLHHYSKTIFTKAQEFNRSFSLHEYFRPMIGNKKEIFVADLGAGMFSTTGSAWDTAKVNLYPSDELADKYMDVLKQQRIKPLIPVEKQDMEQLTYPNEMFDIVHCANALDHCRSPFRAIGEMYRVCKHGGWIYLRHFYNTGELQKYWGEHKWNITVTINRDCIFWGELGNFLLSNCVKGFVSEMRKELEYERYNMVVSKLQKP